MNHYKKWCAARGDRTLRPLDPNSTPLDQKKREILRIARFALWLVQVQGVSANSASAYISTINAWHERRAFVKLAAGASFSFSSQMLKGWARTHPPPRGVFQRIGITPQDLAKGLDLVFGKRGQASKAGQNWRALLVCSFAGLLRGCESCLQDSKPEAFQAIPSRRHCSSQKTGGKVILIREAKRVSFSGVAPCCSTPIQFFPGGSLIDPCLELEELIRIDPASPNSPLFRDPHSNRPLLVKKLRDVVKAVAAASGRDPAFFGAHSLR